jgi:hypothetical protein
VALEIVALEIETLEMPLPSAAPGSPRHAALSRYNVKRYKSRESPKWAEAGNARSNTPFERHYPRLALNKSA